MKIYLAGLSIAALRAFARLVPNYKPNVLITYASIFYDGLKPEEYTKKYRNLIGGLVLDCGAYTLFEKFPNPLDRKIEAEKLFKAYEVYLKNTHNQYDGVFSMDDEFGVDSFDHNSERFHHIQKLGIEPIPVLHNLSDKAEFEYYVNEGCKVVAIGQCKDRKDINKFRKAVNFFKRNQADVHLFGQTNYEVISKARIDSCDSKSWLLYSQYGQVLFWNHERTDHNNPNEDIDKTDLIYFPKVQKHDSSKGASVYDYDHLGTFDEFLEENLGMTTLDLNGNGQRRVLCRQLVNMYYYMELEKVVSNIHLSLPSVSTP
ncbi:hypothetical protein [Maridesulfovibrio sp.]|uniref:hypothetical protein n=1 Tax=Maridesulfovibrio sp. TaxID=2795000 RepID=UPI0039F0FE5D